VLRRNLAEASARSAREIAAGLRARVVRAAGELARPLFDAQSGAMTVDHPHIRAIAIEPNELVGAFTETRVIVTGDADVGFESRKTANSAGEAVGKRRHLKLPGAPYAMEARSTRS
jgi:hypothetical protein